MYALPAVHRHLTSVTRVIAFAAGLGFVIGVGAGCSAAAGQVVMDIQDPAGDPRLEHPRAPHIEKGTFDLRAVRITRNDRRTRVEVTFAAPLARRAAAPELDKGRVDYPQTVDLYLDTGPGGEVASLPGRGFYVPAAEAWDRVLVVSSVRDRPPHPAALVPRHLSHRGRVLVADFGAEAWPEGVRGVVVTVAATSRRGQGRVRAVSGFRGDCTSWDAERCTLYGSGPALLDASVVIDGGLVRLAYAPGHRPRPQGTPIVFQRGSLVTVAPVPDGIADGAMATLLDGDGQPMGTAVVQTVVGDSATLRRVDAVPGKAAETAKPQVIKQAKTVVFARKSGSLE